MKVQTQVLEVSVRPTAVPNPAEKLGRKRAKVSRFTSNGREREAFYILCPASEFLKAELRKTMRV